MLNCCAFTSSAAAQQLLESNLVKRGHRWAKKLWACLTVDSRRVQPCVRLVRHEQSTMVVDDLREALLQGLKSCLYTLANCLGTAQQAIRISQ